MYEVRKKQKDMNQGNKNTILIKRTLSSAMILVIGLVLFSQNVLAATGINKQINFQGKVVNTDGTNVTNGSYNFLFCIYTTASPATACTAGADNDAVWRESKSLTVTDGVFQSNLGDTTAFAALVDFNTDNIYLGINFNSNGQMTPLVRFTAAPYAMNAAKVAGLTVTDTTGTLTIANGKTISFADAFTTSGAFATTLTSTGITNATLPAGTVTLVDLATTQTLTNKTIGSTGLTFTGATTDITTGTGEDLTVTANGAGIISLNDSVTVANALAANGGITFDASSDTVGSFTSAGTILMNTNILQDIGNTGTDFVASTGALTLAGVLTANGGISLTGSQSLTAAALAFVDLGSVTQGSVANQGLRLPNAASATPSNPTSGEGYLAWDAAGNQLITYNGSAWTTLSGGSGYNLIKDETTSLTARTTLAFLGAGVSCADSGSQTECTISGGAGSDLQGTYGTDADGSNTTISLTAADDGLIFTNPSSGGNDLSTFLLQLDQANTTANVLALDIVQQSNASNGANLTANAIDSETGLAITANGLTGGKAISIASSSAAFTGNLADISLTGSNAANTGNVLAISNTGTNNANTSLFIDHRATGTGNLAMRVDDVSGDTTPFIIDGNGRVGIGTSALSANSATERMLQVGSESNRGNSVTYGEVATKGLKDITGLNGIKDVFLYDTTADSDGGRWIDWATTDRLSWYTETLDDGPNDACDIANDDRCYSQSFPRKAILAVTASALYIFDATNNVMWMKFTQHSSGYALGADTNNDPSSVTALNGVIYVGAKGTASGGLYAIDFVNDRMWNYDATDRAGANVGINGRNGAVVYASDAKTALQLDPVGTSAEWMNVNDVAAVSVNSSLSAITIGAATNVIPGQGQSFVALATDSGVTIINLAAQKLLQYSDVTADNYEAVVLTKHGKMYALNSTSDQLEKWDAIDSDKASEVNGAYTSRWTAAVGPALAVGTVAIQTDAPDALEVVERASLAQDNLDLIYVGHNLGLTEIHDHTTVTQGWSKFYNTTRQTMLMPNAIDSALPMDETTGTVAQDASFNNTDMEYKGTYTLGANGVRGKGVALNNTGFLCSNANAGTDSTCDNDAAFASTTVSFTISMWFKHSTTAPATPDVLYEKCYNTSGAVTVGCVVAYMTTTGTIVGAIDATTTFTQFTTYDVTATSTLTYNDDQWHFLVMSRDNANDMNVYIDGQALNLSNATGQTATVDAALQVVSIGASCVGQTDCATGVNFWDGSIDDFTFSSGATTVSQLLSAPARRLYNDARPLVGKKTITVTDATAATSTTLQETGSGWIPNEFAGLILTITSGTGVGQSRRVISNTTDTLTVSPAFDTTPDTTTDFEVDPESLYGASDIVNAIGITAESPLGEARMMCAGTNSTTDTGGATCYNHQAGPNVVAEVFHADAKKLDDSNAEWTGTDYDDIKSIDLAGRSITIGSMGHMYSRTEDVRLGQGLDYLASQLFNIRGEIIQDGIILTGNLGSEVGFTGGADLAEYYYSDEALVAGEIVSTDDAIEAGVKKTAAAYDRSVLGVVATAPGLILGDKKENSYPIALVGRVPVQVTSEGGPVVTGDRIVPSSTPGKGMRALEAGRVVGMAIEDVPVDAWVSCEDGSEYQCATVMVFVNASEYLGANIEMVMKESDAKKASSGSVVTEADVEMERIAETVKNTIPTSWSLSQSEKGARVLAYLNESRIESEGKKGVSEVFAGRIIAREEIIAPTIITDLLIAKRIKADSIEGLQIFTDRIAALEEADTEKVAPIDESTLTDATKAAVTETLKSMKAVSFDRLIVKMEFVVNGKFKALSGMFVDGDAEFAGKSIFGSDVALNGQTSFAEAPMYMTSIAGYAVIEKGSDEVRVSFDTEWEVVPIIQITMVYTGKDGKVTDFFDAKYRSVIKNADEEGFTILLNQEAADDVKFAWTALQVKDAKTWKSGEKEVKKVEVVAPIISETASVSEVIDPIVPQTPVTEIIQEEAVPVEGVSPGDNTQAEIPIADIAS